MISATKDMEVLPEAQTQRQSARLPLGAHALGEGQCSFHVWAPHAKTIELLILSPEERRERLVPSEHGYHSAIVDGVRPGARYFYLLDGEVQRPDPASRFQPEGVHGPSEVVDPQFRWADGHWFGLPLRDYIFYEVHVGTATSEGTFDALIPLINDWKTLGVTAIELMPVAQFPGSRNWGYDGVFPYAVQNSYGGPAGLRRFVNACHAQGLAVVLDVVYNHIGPEGNYLPDFGPYFTKRYSTPWGEALNFDGEHSNEVRRFFLENALQWQRDFHIDALRLDAVHAIRDSSATPFLQDLARATRLQSERSNRRFFLIAESDMNNARIIRPESIGGFGLDAQWSDDFHHVLHVLLTGEREGYYEDFGGTRQLAKCFEEGFVYTGEYSAHRKRNHGAPAHQTSPCQFVVYAQNHDQVGNRIMGDRLTELVGLEKLKLAATTVILSPFLPLLFMGEEYGETAPFQYIVSHSDLTLLEAVRKGRREEFAAFQWEQEMPDPAEEATFEKCRLNPAVCLDEGDHAVLREFYKELIRLRKTAPALVNAEKGTVRAVPLGGGKSLAVIYAAGQNSLCLLLNFQDTPARMSADLLSGTWRKRLASADPRWGGAGDEIPEVFEISGMLSVHCPGSSATVFQEVSRDPAGG